MTHKRNLGPILALTGGGIALTAVIAGFIVVGGPGDARDRRLDEMTSQRVLAIARVAQCAYSTSRTAPATFDAALKARGRLSTYPKDTEEVDCATAIYQNQFTVQQGRTPPNFGDVSYDVIAPDRIVVCGNFRTAYDSETECTELCLRPPGHIELGNSRTIGVNCYEQQLW